MNKTQKPNPIDVYIEPGWNHQKDSMDGKLVSKNKDKYTISKTTGALMPANYQPNGSSAKRGRR